MQELPLLTKIVDNIINPAIALMFGAAVVYFMFGIVGFIGGKEFSLSDKKSVKTGPPHILYGTLGLFIMISAYGIMHIICNTIQCN